MGSILLFSTLIKTFISNHIHFISFDSNEWTLIQLNINHGYQVSSPISGQANPFFQDHNRSKSPWRKASKHTYFDFLLPKKALHLNPAALSYILSSSVLCFLSSSLIFSLSSWLISSTFFSFFFSLLFCVIFHLLYQLN